MLTDKDLEYDNDDKYEIFISVKDEIIKQCKKEFKYDSFEFVDTMIDDLDNNFLKYYKENIVDKKLSINNKTRGRKIHTHTNQQGGVSKVFQFSRNNELGILFPMIYHYSNQKNISTEF